MSMFNHIQAAPADPILGLGEAFKAEQRASKPARQLGGKLPAPRASITTPSQPWCASCSSKKLSIPV